MQENYFKFMRMTIILITVETSTYNENSVDKLKTKNRNVLYGCKYMLRYI